MKEILIVENVSKEFNIGFKKKDNFFKNFLASLSGVENKKRFFAFKNISFSLKEGENFGVLGRNGSGKSTLLNVIAGKYIANSGNIICNEKIFYMSGYGVGLNSKLTARENIYFVGMLYGLSKKEIEFLFDKIVSFSGLEDFLDTKLNHFSSGMRSRLSFSIGVHCIIYKKPKLILMDEVFSGGGDAEFKEKANKKVEELINGNVTIIFATHSVGLLKEYCQKAIVLEKGEIISEGKPIEVINSYKKLIKERLSFVKKKSKKNKKKVNIKKNNSFNKKLINNKDNNLNNKKNNVFLRNKIKRLRNLNRKLKNKIGRKKIKRLEKLKEKNEFQ